MLEHIFHVNINVTNFERSIEFYKMLGFRVVMDLGECGSKAVEKAFKMSKGGPNAPLNARGKAAILALGDGEKAALIDVIEWTTPKTAGKPLPTLYNTGIARICMKTKNLQKDYEDLKAKGVKFLSEPQVGCGHPSFNPKFVMFTDPDGTFLELFEDLSPTQVVA